MCNSTIVGENNNVSLINIIEQLNVPPLPADDKPKRMAFPFELVTLWQREGDVTEAIKIEARVRLVDWKDRELMKVEYHIEIPRSKKRMRAITKFPGVEIKGVGNHRFVIELKDIDGFTPVGSVPFEIRIKSEKA